MNKGTCIPAEERFWRHVDRTGECWLWTGALMRHRRGYGEFAANTKTHVPVYAHRFSYEIENGPIPAGMLVRHKCDTPNCVRPDHLELGTHADNMRDMAARKRKPSCAAIKRPAGERNGQAKLRAVQVAFIRQYYSRGRCDQKLLATVFGVSVPAISDIVNFRRWRHIEDAR